MYAIQSVNGAWNSVINNKDQAQTQTLNVTIEHPQTAQAAQLIAMTGSSVDATTGVAIQGSAIRNDGTFSPDAATTLQTNGSSVACYVALLSVVLVRVVVPFPTPLTVVSSARSFGVAAPASLATAYGDNVSLRDSAGGACTAGLSYSSPSQVNFELPAGVSTGAAVVTIGTQTAMLRIAAVAPGSFTLNGSGLAAAYVVRVAPGNVQTVESVFATQNGSYVAAPIDLIPSTDQFYLILFGTGIRGAGNSVVVTVGGVNEPVAYTGPQGGYPGLDQINVLLPSQLAGSGTVEIALVAAGIAANTVNVAIQ